MENTHCLESPISGSLTSFEATGVARENQTTRSARVLARERKRARRLQSQFTDLAPEHLFLFERGPLALVAERDLNPRPLGYEPYDARLPRLPRSGQSR
jgi:hypothetical protein